MRPVARMLYVVVAWLLVAGLVVQVWLAGRGIFDIGSMPTVSSATC